MGFAAALVVDDLVLVAVVYAGVEVSISRLHPPKQRSLRIKETHLLGRGLLGGGGRRRLLGSRSLLSGRRGGSLLSDGGGGGLLWGRRREGGQSTASVQEEAK